MRILFLNRYFSPDDSATSVLLAELASELAQAGHDVHVLTSRQLYNDRLASLPSQETLHRVRVHRLWATRFGRAHLAGRFIDYMTFHASCAWRLALLARRGDIVVAKTDPPMISVGAAWVCRLRGCRLVNWLQDIFPEIAIRLALARADGATARIALALRDRSLRIAAANVVLGAGMARHVGGIASAERVHVIPNWADGTAVRPIAPEHNPLRREWRLDGLFVVGYSGNMGRAHDFAPILDAAERLREQTHVAFVFVGAGRSREWLERECRARGLPRVSFERLVPRERLAESLSVADVHLISLRAELEGLIVPSKFYGIAAAGRPVIFIGDADGEIATLVRGAQCGVVVAPGDGASLATAVATLAGDRERARAMGERARRLFEQRFERRAAMARWQELLGALDTSRRDPPTMPEPRHRSPSRADAER